MRVLALTINSLALILAFTWVAQACGPGRSGFRRGRLRKLKPMILHQCVPSVSEHTLGASGKPEGAVGRHDRRFRELVQNENPDIEFREGELRDRKISERRGANRMMTQRLKEKLSILAISVMNQWPNVKLRVIEGWDEQRKHSAGSLHYEGRAVDIMTSDRDPSKNGMLARLAVEAGFDWVHYESRSYVHCSVKSERSGIIKNNGCFHAASLVQTPEGEMEMSQVQVNDLVLTLNTASGQFQYSPVIMWMDRDESGTDLFVELVTSSKRRIRLTSSHLIYISDDLNNQIPDTNNQANNINYTTKTTNAQRRHMQQQLLQQQQQQQQQLVGEMSAIKYLDSAYVTYARNAVVGQFLLIKKTTTTTKQQDLDYNRRASRLWTAAPDFDYDQIVAINYVSKLGIYAPLTREGTIVVDSIVASCYAMVSDQEMAHMAFAPIRWFSYAREWMFGLKPETPLKTRTLDAITRLQNHYHNNNNNNNNNNNKQITTELENIPTTTARMDDTNSIDRSLSLEAQSEHTGSTTRQIHWYPMMLYNIARFILPTKYIY